MSLHDVVSAERIHIGFFGMRNAGKSSLVNAVTNQQLAVVSNVKGTTTDPVKKAMELLPLGPVLIIDTPGLDDEGELGLMRVKKAKQELAHTDVAVLVVDATTGLCDLDKDQINNFKARQIPYIVVYNKADLLENRPELPADSRYASSLTGEGIHELKEALGQFAEKKKNKKVLVSDLLTPGDLVVLVIPIDESAPKGRLILPQQMTVRDILDHHSIAITCQDDEVKATLEKLAIKPRLVITDSQAFEHVSRDVPDDIPLTSFSILMARYKGDLKTMVQGAAALKSLKDGDRILISEGCTHHRQCNDLGTVQIPDWVSAFSGAKLEFSFTSGGEFPDDLSDYALVIHCGGCMLNEAEMKHRIEKCVLAGTPIVNYGLAIAQIHGILERSILPIPGISEILK